MSPLRPMTVIGSGPMGAELAVHLANTGHRVLFLAEPRATDAVDGGAERRAAEALRAARESRPGGFWSARFEGRVALGSLPADSGGAAAGEVIFVAVPDGPEVWDPVLACLEAAGGRAPVALVSSTESIATLTGARERAFCRRVCLAHFSYPPRFRHLVELAAGEGTDPEVLDIVEELCAGPLGKEVVRTADRPGFIAKRLATFAILHAVRVGAATGSSAAEIDDLFGPAMGQPSSALFRAADLWGVDTVVSRAQHYARSLPGGGGRSDLFAVPKQLQEMIDRGRAGPARGRSGFYRRDGDRLLALDLASMRYVEHARSGLPAAVAREPEEIRNERLRAVMSAAGADGIRARRLVLEILARAADLVGEVTEDLSAIDRAMVWGCGWGRGPFEIWDILGLRWTRDRMREEGVEPPGWIDRSLEEEATTFHQRPAPGDRRVLCRAGGHVRIASGPGELSFEELRRWGKAVETEAGASLVDLGEGVLGLELHGGTTNPLTGPVIEAIGRAVSRVEREGAALVIGSSLLDAFSVGDDLAELLVMIDRRDFTALDGRLGALQSVVTSLRRAAFPVIAAPLGMTVGTGAELVLACHQVSAYAELYMGCPQVALGLIPAAGGCLEMLARAQPGHRAPGPPLDERVSAAFALLAGSRLSTSAEQARDLGYLGPEDTVVLQRRRLLTEAKALSSRAPRPEARPPPRRLVALGPARAEELAVTGAGQGAAGGLTEHDLKVRRRLAGVLCGGSASGEVEEQTILDLEREAFLSLAGEEKTVARLRQVSRGGPPPRT